VPLLRRLVARLCNGPSNPDAHTAAVCARVAIARAEQTAHSSGILSLTSRYLLERFTRKAGGGLDRWELAFRWSGPEQGPHPTVALDDYVALAPPPDRFWADPFPLQVGGKTYILFEELLFAQPRGYIRALELGRDGPVGDPITILNKPYHLSYPFTFEHGGTTYLLPESCLEGRLDLYRATRAPFEWTFHQTLLDNVRLIDPTLAHIGDRWWLFACSYLPELREWNDLVVYFANSPFGPWTPHPRNPVVSDVRWARPAGALYSVDGVWYRAAQDCSRTYGGALTLRQIVRLSETEYEEVSYQRIEPGQSSEFDGVHTINRLNNLTVVDRKRR
jgi:hypothetical protein